MNHNDAVKQYLTSLGWIYKGSCNCGGYMTWKYRYENIEGEYLLKLRKSHYLISTPNDRFKKYPIGYLKQHLDEISKIGKATV